MNRISPTAHFTGYSWIKMGFSDPVLSTPEGAFLYYALAPFDVVTDIFSSVSLRRFLYARHALIDHLCREYIQNGYTQVIEVAAGLSGRSIRFTKEFPDLNWIELDLPGMSSAKHEKLSNLGLLHSRLHCVAADALNIDHVFSALENVWDTKRRTIIITEGLINYLTKDQLTVLWENFAKIAARLPETRYLSDLHPRENNSDSILIQLGRSVLGAFVRGKVNFHFSTEQECETELKRHKFEGGWLHPADFSSITGVHPNQSSPVRIINAIFSKGENN